MAKIIHGYPSRKHPLYSHWDNMKARCYRKTSPRYYRYGGRGIKVCNKWLNNFEAFAKDMYPNWIKGLSLDRINSNGDYQPNNCRWATTLQQNRNTSANIKILYKNKIICMAELSEITGIKYDTLRYRREQNKDLVPGVYTKIIV